MATELESRLEIPPVVRRARMLRRRRHVLSVAAVIVLLPTAALYHAYADDVDRGVHVLGVDLGGSSRAEAADLLRHRLGDRLTAPLAVRVGTVAAAVDPAQIGLVLDIDATVERAANVTPELFGQVDVAPVVRVDPTRLFDTLAAHLGAQGDMPVLPAVRFDRLRPMPVYPVSGRGLDRTQAVDLVTRDWLRRSTVDLPVVDVVPRTSHEDVDRLVHDLAMPAIAAPLVLATPRGEVLLPVTAIAAALRMESDVDGRIEPTLDETALRRAVPAAFAKVEVAPTDATFAVEQGHPVVKPHLDGQAVDLAGAMPDILTALRQSATPRRVTVQLTAAPPATTAAQLAGLGVKEQLATFTTKFDAGQPRAVNIRTMAEALRGAVVRPGATFSLNQYVGERTHAKGYVDAPSIEEGKLKNSSGGGVSQVATTLFNAVYAAGLQDVEHQPHSYYFDRYPAVIDATVVYPSVDLQFRNDAPTGVLIDTASTPTSVTVTVYGTKRFDVTTEYGPRSRIVQPETTYLRDKDCNPADGVPGFDQEAFRVFELGGKEVRRERFFWRYEPEPHFVCGAPPPGLSPLRPDATP